MSADEEKARERQISQRDQRSCRIALEGHKGTRTLTQAQVGRLAPDVKILLSIRSGRLGGFWRLSSVQYSRMSRRAIYFSGESW